jgi:hypothetical protein
MLEQGLAVIVACLPTLRCLLNLRALESVINSVRSVVSLQSIRSRQSSNGSGAANSRNVGSQYRVQSKGSGVSEPTASEAAITGVGSAASARGASADADRDVDVELGHVYDGSHTNAVEKGTENDSQVPSRRVD